MVFPAYHEGTALDRCVQRPIAKAFTPAQLLSIGTQLCSALEHMHGMGIAHYDVKPGNVLLESVMDDASHRGGMKAVLMDFGSARVARRAVTSRQEALQLQELAEIENGESFSECCTVLGKREREYEGGVAYELLLLRTEATQSRRQHRDPLRCTRLGGLAPGEETQLQ